MNPNMLLKRSPLRVIIPALAGALLVAATTPLFAWYFFTSPGGDRMQWVFGTSCNASGARPIQVRFDTDTPGSYAAAITALLADWNTAAGTNTLLARAGDTTISVATYAAFLSAPQANQIWVAYDLDGSILSYLGVSSNSILGIGLPLATNPARPQDICSGLIVLNGKSLASGAEYGKTLLHEMGHVLGFAHNIAGGNGQTIKFASISNNTLSVFQPLNLPVMYPFAVSGATSTLNADDKAGAYAVYGP